LFQWYIFIFYISSDLLPLLVHSLSDSNWCYFYSSRS